MPWKRGDRGIIPPPHGESITRERRGRIALASSSALPSREEGRAYRKRGDAREESDACSRQRRYHHGAMAVKSGGGGGEKEAGAMHSGSNCTAAAAAA